MMLKIHEVTGTAGTVKVYWDAEWEQYIGKLSTNPMADFYTDDKHDAIDTAKCMANLDQQYEVRGEDGDEQVRCNTPKQFHAYCVGGCWNGAYGFEQSTGVSFEELEGKWFSCVGNRIFISDN